MNTTSSTKAVSKWDFLFFVDIALNEIYVKLNRKQIQAEGSLTYCTQKESIKEKKNIVCVRLYQHISWNWCDISWHM